MPHHCAMAAATHHRSASVAGSALFCSTQRLTKYGMKAHSEPSLPDNSQLKCHGKETLPPSPLPSSHPSNTLLFRLSESSCKKHLRLIWEGGRHILPGFL